MSFPIVEPVQGPALGKKRADVLAYARGQGYVGGAEEPSNEDLLKLVNSGRQNSRLPPFVIVPDDVKMIDLPHYRERPQERYSW